MSPPLIRDNLDLLSLQLGVGMVFRFFAPLLSPNEASHIQQFQRYQRAEELSEVFVCP